VSLSTQFIAVHARRIQQSLAVIGRRGRPHRSPERPREVRTKGDAIRDRIARNAERRIAIAEKMKAEAGGVTHGVVDQSVGGMASLTTSIIAAPVGENLQQLYTVAHECGHVFLHRKGTPGFWLPGHVKEWEAECYAHQAFHAHGLRVPARFTTEARAYVALHVEIDRRDGIATDPRAWEFAEHRCSPFEPLRETPAEWGMPNARPSRPAVSAQTEQRPSQPLSSTRATSKPLAPPDVQGATSLLTLWLLGWGLGTSIWFGVFDVGEQRALAISSVLFLAVHMIEVDLRRFVLLQRASRASSRLRWLGLVLLWAMMVPGLCFAFVQAQNSAILGPRPVHDALLLTIPVLALLLGRLAIGVLDLRRWRRQTERRYANATAAENQR
jgi:hypothetical protein